MVKRVTYAYDDSNTQYDKPRTFGPGFLEERRNTFAFLMFGVGMLLPWNAMLAAMDYFTDKFPDYKPSFSLLVAVSVPMLLV